MPRGGERPGAGRPRKQAAPATDAVASSRRSGRHALTAAEYLAQIVADESASRSDRLRAAIALLPCERPRALPAPSPLRPRERAALEAKATERARVEDFEKRAAEIRARHGRE